MILANISEHNFASPTLFSLSLSFPFRKQIALHSCSVYTETNVSRMSVSVQMSPNYGRTYSANAYISSRESLWECTPTPAENRLLQKYAFFVVRIGRWLPCVAVVRLLAERTRTSTRRILRTGFAFSLRSPIYLARLNCLFPGASLGGRAWFTSPEQAASPAIGCGSVTVFLFNLSSHRCIQVDV